MIKPAEITPLLALRLARLCEEAGLPKGLISVLPGKGSLLGDALTRHPLVKRVSFTGGTRTGKHIAHIAADKMMPVSWSWAASRRLSSWMTPTSTTQWPVCCTAFPARGVYCRFAAVCCARLVRTLYAAPGGRRRQPAHGRPADENTQMGPLISAGHRESVERYVALGLAEGGRLRLGGQRPSGGLYDQGYFYPPTILEGLHNQQQVCQEEIFGPVLVAMPFDDEEQLLEQANDSLYALAAGIWSRDYKRAWALGRRLQAGTVWINTYKQFSISIPFGGYPRQWPGPRKRAPGDPAIHGTEEPLLGHEPTATGLGRCATRGSVMSVLGIDEVTYGVEDLDTCVRFFSDWGLKQLSTQADEVIFETLNGCRVVLADLNKPGLPPAIEAGSTVREIGTGAWPTPRTLRCTPNASPTIRVLSKVTGASAAHRPQRPGDPPASDAQARAADRVQRPQHLADQGPDQQGRADL